METAVRRQKRTPLAYVRNMLAIPLAGVTTILYVTWQLVMEQQLFLRTFLVERMGKRGVAEIAVGLLECVGAEEHHVVSASI